MEQSHKPCLRQLKGLSFLYHPSSAQEPLNRESFRGNFQRNNLREGFFFLHGCIKEVLVNTISPKQTMQDFKPVTLVLWGATCPTQHARAHERKTACAKVPGIKAGPQACIWGIIDIQVTSSWSCELPSEGQALCIPLR